MSSILSQQSLGLDAIMDFASVASTEIAMFVVAALIYFTWGSTISLKKPGKATKRESVPSGQFRAATSAAPWKKGGNVTSKPKRNDVAERSSANAAGAIADIAKTASTIKAFARDNDLDGAMATLRKFSEDGAPPNAVLHNCMLDAFVQCGDLERALSLVEEMKSLGLVDVVTYNTMLKSYLKQGKIAKAQGLLLEMKSAGLKPSAVTYHELLNAMVENRDTRGMWLLVAEMTKAGVTPSSITCSILLKAVAERSDPADVQRTMSLMMSLEGPMDEVLLSSAIEACIRVKQLGLLSDLIKRYRSRPDGLGALSAPSYGSMIKAFGQAGNTAQVHELWLDMEQRDVKPSPITLGCMVEALVVNGQAEEAWGLLRRQQEVDTEEVLVNTVVYSTVLKGFATAKQIEKVFIVYQEMKERGMECNTITYNTLLDACAKCDLMSRTPELLKDMQKDNVEPDLISYSTLIKGYCLEGSIDRAFSVLHTMKAEGKLQADEIMYNSLLDGCAKQQRVEEALKVLKEMEASENVKPSNFTLSILVKLLGRARRLGQAFEVVEDISARYKVRLNVQVYTCLMQACMFNKKLDRALALHDTMVKAGCSPDERLYVALIRGCLHCAPRKAADVVRAAFQLPGGALAISGGRAAGVDEATVEEVCKILQSGSAEDKAACTSLKADLASRRKAGRTSATSYCNSGSGSSVKPWRRGGGDK